MSCLLQSGLGLSLIFSYHWICNILWKQPHYEDNSTVVQIRCLLGFCTEKYICSYNKNDYVNKKSKN